MDLLEILATLTTDEGLAVAMIVGRDGLMIEGQSRTGSTDLESIAAMTTHALAELERLGRLVAGGSLSQLRLRYENYLLVVETLSSTDLLVCGITGAGNSERLLDAVARYRLLLQQTLSDLG